MQSTMLIRENQPQNLKVKVLLPGRWPCTCLTMTSPAVMVAPSASPQFMVARR